MQDLEALIEHTERLVLANLMRNPSQTQAVYHAPGATATAFRLANGSATAAQMPGGNDTILVPAAALSLPDGEQAAAAVVVVVDRAVLGDIKSENEAGKPVGVRAAMNVNLFSAAGVNVPVDNSSEDFQLTMETNCQSDLSCAYWDGNTSRWMTEGVQLVVDNTTGSCQLRCSSSHLTLFASLWQGFLQALLCTQLELFSSDSLQKLTAGGWFYHDFALLFWAILLSFTAICAGACVLDARKAWPDDYFLLPLDELRELEPRLQERGTEDEVEGDGPDDGGALVACVSERAKFTVRGFFTSLVESAGSSLRDALDDIASRWCSSFGQARELLESLCDGLQLGEAEGRGSWALRMASQVVGALVASTAKRQAGASLGISTDLVSFVLDDEDLGMLITIAAMRANVEPRTQQEKRMQAWRQLHEKVLSHLDMRWRETSWRLLPAAVLRLFLVANPVSAVFLKCRLLPHSLRALLFVSEFLGALMVAAFFFEGTGMVKSNVSDVDCSADGGDFWFELGQILAIVVVSTIIAGLPVMIMSSLHGRRFHKCPFEGSKKWSRQLRAWRVQDKLLWGIGILYNATCILVIALFLANVAPTDLPDWGLGALMQVLEEQLILPVCIALLVPLMTLAFLSLVVLLRKISRQELLQESRAAVEHNGGNWQQSVLSI